MSVNRLIKNAYYYVVFIFIFAYVYINLSVQGDFKVTGIFSRNVWLMVLDIMMIMHFMYHYRFIQNAYLFVRLVLLWIIWMVFSFINLYGYGVGELVIGVLETLFSPLIFLFFYITVKRKSNLFEDSRTIFFFLLLFSFVLYLFVYDYKAALSIFSSPLLNSVYYVLLLLPWVLILPNKLYRNVGIIIIAIAVLLSMKRTVIIAFIISLVLYYLLEQKRLRKPFSLKILFQVMFLVAALYVPYVYIEQKTGGFFEQRLSSIYYDRGSGRLDIYLEVIRLLESNTLWFWIFGHGHNTVRTYNAVSGFGDFSAHNDWLEIVFDYGVIGLFLYIIFHYLLIKYGWFLMRKRSLYGPAMVVSYIMFFIISLTSHLVLYASYFGYLMAFWGALFAFVSAVDKKA